MYCVYIWGFLILFDAVYSFTATALHCYTMSPSSRLKLDLRLESTDASGDMADSSGSPPIGDKGSSIIKKPRSPLLPWTSSPPRSPSPDMPSENPCIPSHRSSDWAKSKGWELPTAGNWMGCWGGRCCESGGSCWT